MNPSGAIEGLAIAKAMREYLWLYPAVEIVHIVGFVILVGSVVMFDLRVLGLSRRVPCARSRATSSRGASPRWCSSCPRGS